MTRQNDTVNDLIRSENACGRLRAWDKQSYPGFFVVEMTYFDERDAHAMAGTLHGSGIRIDSVNTAWDIGETTTKIVFRASTDGRVSEPVACPACTGRGHIKLDTCWHCDGEGIDPAP